MGSDEAKEKMDEQEVDSPAVEENSEQDLDPAAEMKEVGNELDGDMESTSQESEVSQASDVSGAGDTDDPFSEERIQRILDIELPVNISFGSTKRPLSEVLKLGPGALLELDRAVDEPVVLKVNNKVFAKGEIVDVDGYYGVQITEISSPAQRIASLGD